MQAIILAAGMGKRLGKYANDSNKCLIEINGMTLIEKTIESLVLNNIRNIYIVTGYRHKELKDYILHVKSCKYKKKDVSVNFIENENYDKTNNIYSLFLTKDVLKNDDTLLLESDLIYDCKLIDDLLKAKEDNIALLSPYESWMDGTCVILDKQNKIIQFIDKNKFKKKEMHKYMKTVNIYKFSANFLSKYYIPYLTNYIEINGKNDYYEQVFQTILNDATSSDSFLYGLVISSTSWHEIDNYMDLVNANEKFTLNTNQEKNQ